MFANAGVGVPALHGGPILAISGRIRDRNFDACVGFSDFTVSRFLLD